MEITTVGGNSEDSGCLVPMSVIQSLFFFFLIFTKLKNYSIKTLQTNEWTHRTLATVYKDQWSGYKSLKSLGYNHKLWIILWNLCHGRTDTHSEYREAVEHNKMLRAAAWKTENVLQNIFCTVCLLCNLQARKLTLCISSGHYTTLSPTIINW